MEAVLSSETSVDYYNVASFMLRLFFDLEVVQSSETSVHLYQQFVACFLLVCCVTYPSILKMEAARIKPVLLL
jgi:hypothetical protein